MKYRLLHEKVRIGKKTAGNRIVVPPMADLSDMGTDGMVGQRHLNHYRALAEGGAGTIIVEACTVDPVHERRNTIELYDDRSLPGMTALAGVIHGSGTGTLALCQLLNAGIGYLPERSLAEISPERFTHYLGEFVEAAVRCQRAGFDGIELHAAHGYFLNQLLESGMENRYALLSELVQKIRAATAEDFIIAARIGNRDVDALIRTAEVLEDAGADLVDVSSGMGPCEKPAGFAFDEKIYAASRVHAHTALPVICVGGIREGSQVEEVLRAGYADLVAVGRAQLADPSWAAKVLKA